MHAGVICINSEQRYMQHDRPDLTLQKLSREHAATEMITVYNAKDHNCYGPAAAEQKSQSCIIPPLGWRWQGKKTAAHQNISSKQGS